MKFTLIAAVVVATAPVEPLKAADPTLDWFQGEAGTRHAATTGQAATWETKRKADISA